MKALKSQIEEHLSVFKSLDGISVAIEKANGLIVNALKNKNKVFICGNGGSAADAQHFAAELTGHYVKERPPLAAIALTTDTSALTAIGNDYCYEEVFSRQLLGLAREGDVFIGITTSGNSKNVIKALQVAHELKMDSILMTGKTGGVVKSHLAHDDVIIQIPSTTTSRVQECHIFILHSFCESLEPV